MWSLLSVHFARGPGRRVCPSLVGSGAAPRPCRKRARRAAGECDGNGRWNSDGTPADLRSLYGCAPPGGTERRLLQRPRRRRIDPLVVRFNGLARHGQNPHRARPCEPPPARLPGSQCKTEPNGTREREPAARLAIERACASVSVWTGLTSKDIHARRH
jgi:hypothetical protein